VYLKHLKETLPTIFDWNPDLVFYLAGADPFVNDKLGRLALSIEGLRRRDSYVLQQCFLHEVPVATVMSGGYGKDIRETIEIHCNTIRSCKQIFEPRSLMRAAVQIS
jgi:acetoin utilization deacetylase AcuC-like enzyme